MNAAKCKAIKSQEVSHNLEMGVWPRRATEANAQVKSATAAKSGSFVQSTTFLPRGCPGCFHQFKVEAGPSRYSPFVPNPGIDKLV